MGGIVQRIGTEGTRSVNLRLALSPILSLILTGCFSSDSSDTVARAKSPSGAVEALLDENNGGGPTRFGDVVSVRAGSSSGTFWGRGASAFWRVRRQPRGSVGFVGVDCDTVRAY